MGHQLPATLRLMQAELEREGKGEAEMDPLLLPERLWLGEPELLIPKEAVLLPDMLAELEGQGSAVLLPLVLSVPPRELLIVQELSTEAEPDELPVAQLEPGAETVATALLVPELLEHEEGLREGGGITEAVTVRVVELLAPADPELLRVAVEQRVEL